MNDIHETLLQDAIDDAVAVRKEAMANAQKALEEAFGEKLGNVDDLDDSDLDTLVNELEKEIEEPPVKKKKTSFFNNLIISICAKRVQQKSDMVTRFQRLAGIKTINPAAKLTIGNNTFDLSEIPPWYNILRFRLCGFKLVIYPER
jgi:hypothetical protein